MMYVTLLILIRHGQSMTNKESFLSDSEDKYPLTELGVSQAEATAKELKRNFKVSKIYSSTTYRAKQTAGILAKELGMDIVLDKRLKERGWGLIEGKPALLGAWRFNMSEEEAKSVENWESIKKRVASFASDVSKENGVIVGVSHVDPIAALAVESFGINADELSVYALVAPFASMNFFGYESKSYRVLATGLPKVPQQVLTKAMAYVKQ